QSDVPQGVAVTRIGPSQTPFWPVPSSLTREDRCGFSAPPGHRIRDPAPFLQLPEGSCAVDGFASDGGTPSAVSPADCPWATFAGRRLPDERLRRDGFFLMAGPAEAFPSEPKRVTTYVRLRLSVSSSSKPSFWASSSSSLKVR